MRYAFLFAISLPLAACGSADRPQQSNATDASAPAPASKGVDRSQAGKAFPGVAFLKDDGDGAGEMSAGTLLGTPVLVNFWASWCAPCVKELPTLMKLSRSREFDGTIIPLNQDNGPQSSVRAFMEKHGVDELGNYQDPGMKVAGALGVEVMPTTILFDANGREVWRYLGDLDWSGPEAAKLLAEADVKPGYDDR